jgi:hypothetical protein
MPSRLAQPSPPQEAPEYYVYPAPASERLTPHERHPSSGPVAARPIHAPRQEHTKMTISPGVASLLLAVTATAALGIGVATAAPAAAKHGHSTLSSYTRTMVTPPRSGVTSSPTPSTRRAGSSTGSSTGSPVNEAENIPRVMSTIPRRTLKKADAAAHGARAVWRQHPSSGGQK